MLNKRTLQKIKEEFKETFLTGTYQGDGEEMLSFLTDKLQEVERETASYILIQLDHLEMEQPEDLKTDNWRNWKYIRNAIVDKYDLLSHLKIGEERIINKPFNEEEFIKQARKVRKTFEEEKSE